MLIDTGHGQPALLHIDATGVSADTAPVSPDADLVLSTDPETTVGLLTGEVHPETLDPEGRTHLRGTNDARRRFIALTDRARTTRAAGPAA